MRYRYAVDSEGALSELGVDFELRSEPHAILEPFAEAFDEEPPTTPYPRTRPGGAFFAHLIESERRFRWPGAPGNGKVSTCQRCNVSQTSAPVNLTPEDLVPRGRKTG